MGLEKRVWLSGEEAEWLADKIVAYGDYGNDAARMLRRLSTIEQQRDELLAALREITIRAENEIADPCDVPEIVYANAVIAKADLTQ